MPKIGRTHARGHHVPHWLGRIPPKDRQAVDAVADWLRPVNWQWFVTLTFPWNVRAETAVRKLRQFVDKLEKATRSNACFVAGQESKPHSDGMNVPPHFHLLLASNARISREAIEAIWLGLVNHSSADRMTQDSVRAEPFNPNEPGAPYCLKSLNDDHGDWFIHRLDQFLPGAPGPSKPNHRTVRRARRAKLQTGNV